MNHVKPGLIFNVVGKSKKKWRNKFDRIFNLIISIRKPAYNDTTVLMEKKIAKK